jgi:very-short-patch-repair endonuclease
MEQMVLFHSATLNDLKEQCLQHKLLSHCLNPSVEQLPIADMSLNKFREIARSTDRVRGNQPSPFDSWFEVDVFLQLANRGYQLMPQYTVNPNDNTYRIDIVVLGMNGKLAIECDGDHWHGPAEYESDMARQRELERCGWEFWRVRGGAFYRDQEAAMASLWGLLEKQGIFPEGYQAPIEVPEREETELEQEESLQSDLSQQPKPETLVDITDAPVVTEKISVATQVKSSETTESSLETPASSILYPEPAQSARTGKRIVQELMPADIQAAVLSVLSDQPNHSATVKSIPAKVCKELGIITRGAPRRDLEKRITRSMGVLKRLNRIEEYKAKNNRVRLTGLI